MVAGTGCVEGGGVSSLSSSNSGVGEAVVVKATLFTGVLWAFTEWPSLVSVAGPLFLFAPVLLWFQD